MTWTEITPAVAACPAANERAASIVDDIIDIGTPADATFCETTAASTLPETATPRRASRFASITRALDSRLATLPSGMSSCLAVSLRVRPSKSHRTMTTR